VQSIIYDLVSIIHAISKRQRTLLVLGVSGAFIFPVVRTLFPNTKIITNIDGIEWKRDKWNKFARSYLKFSEKIAVRYSNKVISDNEAIKHYIAEEYGINSEVIPYGGDHHILRSKKLNIDADNDQKEYALSICRIEPENNVHMILEAFSKAKLMVLKFVGNWNSSEYARNLKAEYQDDAYIEIIDAVYDEKTIHNLRKDCKLYIHGHSAGGTNPSLVEIMHYDKTVLAFNCQYNRSTMRSIGLFFDDSQSLISLLRGLSQTHIEEIGKQLGDIARENYTWEGVCNKYHQLLKG